MYPQCSYALLSQIKIYFTLFYTTVQIFIHASLPPTNVLLRQRYKSYSTTVIFYTGAINRKYKSLKTIFEY